MIYIFGDSHARFNFINLKTEHIILEVSSITMHRVGRDREILHFEKSYNNKEDFFIFCYGEIDCRVHVKKQIELGREKQEIIQTLVEAYIYSIKSIVTEYKKIIICAVPPTTRESDYHIIHNNFPFYGTENERVEFTQLMNLSLQKEAEKNGFCFLDYYEYYARDDGTLKYELSDQCVHIKENQYIHEKLYTLVCKSKEEI